MTKTKRKRLPPQLQMLQQSGCSSTTRCLRSDRSTAGYYTKLMPSVLCHAYCTGICRIAHRAIHDRQTPQYQENYQKNSIPSPDNHYCVY